MQETIRQCLDGYEGTWRYGKWQGRASNNGSHTTVYEDTEEQARIALENAVMREEKRVKEKAQPQTLTA